MASLAHDDNSDADSDLEELQGDIAKFDESVREFLASHGGSQVYDKPIRGGARGRGSRGPRKAAKPRGDITARLSRVNQAFLAGDYDRALQLVSEVIRINAETYQAWTALASIFREQRELDRALAAMVYAAHLRPKDIGGWLSCASYALDNIGANEEANVKTARLCYSAALRADPQNVDARLGKAAVCQSQGHYSQAILEYNFLLKQRPADLDIVRKLAETCADNKENPSSVLSAKAAYRRFFDLVIPTGPGNKFEGLWYDIGIYIDFCASSGSYRQTITELKALSRWMVGRASEQYWDEQEDDREWDLDSSRREMCGSFEGSLFSPASYGQSLPLDLRMRLATLRLRLLEKSEAMIHLEMLDSSAQTTVDFITDFPSVAYDLAEELLKNGVADLATKLLEIFRDSSQHPDSTILLQLGRCYIAIGEQPRAEECFLAAIDADEGSIDARIELANMYEKAKEGEEALILAAEAMALRDAQNYQVCYGPADTAGNRTGHEPHRDDSRRRLSHTEYGATAGGQGKQSRVPRRYRPKRLAGADTFRQDEQARAIKLSQQYEIVRDLRRRISEGQSNLREDWMNASRDLVDDFRSLKRFYSWDKYLHFLRKKPSSALTDSQAPDNELSRMYERLTRSLAPHAENSLSGGQQGMHQGISFDNWLNIFLDYAIGLAMNHQREEAYLVCEAAKDSVVFQASNHEFLIHIAWTVCAIYTNDEERCVSIARHLMRDGVMSDSNRMFALLSKLCQSPISWYTSGPAQKFILRQIRSIDNSYEQLFSEKFEEHDAGEVTSSKLDMDVCLLMLYGHILFTSTSYTYAISYFLRARSLDPTNPMVNLSLGLAYVHYGLKRQSTNRQYLLLQGQAFITQYFEAGDGNGARPLTERYYNIGRLFQLLGLHQLAADLYSRAAEANGGGDGNPDIDTLVAINSFMSLLTAGVGRATPTRNSSPAQSATASHLALTCFRSQSHIHGRPPAKMLIASEFRRRIANGLLILAVSSGIGATEQTTPSSPGDSTLRSNNGGPVTDASQCEARTINYITHSLPQSCLTSSWSSIMITTSSTNPISTASVAVEGTPPITATEPAIAKGHDASAPVAAETIETPVSILDADEIIETSETESTSKPFMSFEDWKEMMLQKAGQDPQDLRQRKPSEMSGEDRQKYQQHAGNDALGDEGEVSLNFGSYTDRRDADSGDEESKQRDDHVDELSSEVGQPTLHRNKDAGKTCKERFSFASFDAGATILKTSSGAKNSKAILVENKDTYMLLECATPNKYVIIELTDDIWVDTIVLANFEFFSSMIRHFRVSVSDRYPVKLDKWRELGTFEARNSRDIQAFLVENPQIWAKYLRLEFLTHYSNEYYCPVSLVRVHGSRMLDKWKDSETGPEDDAMGEIEGLPEHDGARIQADEELPSIPEGHQATGLGICNMPPLFASTLLQMPLPMCSAKQPHGLTNNPVLAGTNIPSMQEGEYKYEEAVETSEASPTVPEKSDDAETYPMTSENLKATGVSGANAGNERTSAKSPDTEMSSSSSSPTPSSSSPSASTGRGTTASASNSRPRSNGTNTATPSPPTMQEGFFNSVTKRLQQVETNLTLSLKYVEEQSKHIQHAFQKSEQKQLLKISSVLTDLNQTVLEELRNFRDQYDQIWQSTVLALESQEHQSQRDILALSARLHVLADEVVFQKRMAIVQAVLLLSCLLLVIFSRGVPIPYLGSPSDQSMGTSAAFAEILASMQRRDMYPGGSPRYPVETRTPMTPESHGPPPPERHVASAQMNMQDYGYQRPSPPLTPNDELSRPIAEWQPISTSQTTAYEPGMRHVSARKPLPSLPEDVSSSPERA